jgi:hypothetical protein
VSDDGDNWQWPNYKPHPVPNDPKEARRIERDKRRAQREWLNHQLAFSRGKLPPRPLSELAEVPLDAWSRPEREAYPEERMRRLNPPRRGGPYPEVLYDVPSSEWHPDERATWPREYRDRVEREEKPK